MKTYTTTVGLEIHAELKTQSKMFCGCKNDPHAALPNTHVCPVCMAHPGTLPTVNKQAVALLMQVGKAIGGTLADYSEFDRKNYFYPDIPKAYQISQYKFPFVQGGSIAGVAITRVHLEEDTARSIHDQGSESMVDYNRAGVPLLELVTEPVIHTPQEAATFAKELQLLLRTLGASDANMEKGEMRVEANISVSATDELGTKVEVKNLNSFKSVSASIEYETKRHIDLVEQGQQIIQETRGWDETKGKTFSQRLKETAQDYRYFPDPDIPKFQRSLTEEFSDSRLSEMLPELPHIKREKLLKARISEVQVETIISDIERSAFFDSVLSVIDTTVEPKLAANYFANDLLSIVDAEGLLLKSASAANFASLLKLLTDGKITSRVAKDLLKEAVFEGKDPEILAQERGLIQEQSIEALEVLVQKIISENQNVVAEYKAGKASSIQFLVGQAMKESKGSANPKILIEIFQKLLN